MKSLKRIICALTITLLLSVSLIPSKAQSVEEESAPGASSSVEMADAFREDGKIYVVVAVVLVLLAGMTIYMVNIDRKLNKLEKELDIHH